MPCSIPEIKQIHSFYTYQGQVFDIDPLLEQ
jgi:heat shock protein HspQ